MAKRRSRFRTTKRQSRDIKRPIQARTPHLSIGGSGSDSEGRSYERGSLLKHSKRRLVGHQTELLHGSVTEKQFFSEPL